MGIRIIAMLGAGVLELALVAPTAVSPPLATSNPVMHTGDVASKWFG